MLTKHLLLWCWCNPEVVVGGDTSDPFVWYYGMSRDQWLVAWRMELVKFCSRGHGTLLLSGASYVRHLCMALHFSEMEGGSSVTVTV